MSSFISEKELAELRASYTPGTEVELLEMNDPYRDMPAGLRGIVEMVDDAGGIHIKWSNGSGLAAIPGVDKIKIVATPKKKYRKAGKYKGQMWMSDDFDEPLEDFKDYM